jgi:Ca2+/H+ antiporter, TMEM165/GDT1 family
MTIESWAVAAPAITAAFLASLVEVVEAFTIVLAVATVRGWRPSLLGAAAGLLLLCFWSSHWPFLHMLPLHLLRLMIGVLLLLFGLRWLRKSILRAAGVLALHDENVAFAAESASLLKAQRRSDRHLDWIAGMTALKAVGLAVHKPLARVPENMLKFAVGVVLSAFGMFWVGEGLGLDWPGQDLAILVFALIFFALAMGLVRLTKVGGRVAAR